MELVHNDKRVVLFATPTFDKSVSTDYHNSMLETIVQCARHRIAYGSLVIAGNQFIDAVRNKIVHYFLTDPAGFTDLVFIDADQGWDAKVIPRILSYSQGVVAALPPKKMDEPTFHSNALTGRIENGLFEAKEAGTGFMRIQREVFKAMDRAYPELADMIEPGEGCFWTTTPYFQRGNTRWGPLGEDIFFCRQLEHMGESVWIDPDVTFTHRGSKVWTGNFYDHAVATGLLQKRA